MWRKLQSEDELARCVTEDSHATIRQTRESDADLETTQVEVNRGYGVTVKLESLCRKLQNQTNSLVEERKQLTVISFPNSVSTDNVRVNEATRRTTF